MFSLLLLLVADSSEALVLSEVLAEVDAANPGVVAATHRADSAELRADASGKWNDPFIAVGADEYTLSAEPPVIRYELSQTIPMPGKLGPRVDAARAQARAAVSNVEIARTRARVLAIQIFLRAIYVDSALQTNEAQRQALSEIIASAESRYVTGGASAHHDVLLATAERATLERDVLVLQRERAVLLTQLDELRGRPPGAASRELVDDGADRAPVPATFEDALAAQPELIAARENVDTAEALRRSANAAAIPDVMVQGMAMQSLMPKKMPSNVGLMIGVSVPILFPWKQAPAADAAASEKTAFETERRELELRLRSEWYEAQARLRTAEDTVRLYDEKILPTTQAAMESSRAAYTAGGAPLIEVLAIVRSTNSVVLERVAAELDVRLARVRLANLLSLPSTLSLAPPSPTLFSSGGMNDAAMGTMKKMPMPTTPSTVDAIEGESGMGMGGM